MSINFNNVHQGEVWLVSFSPSVGSEIQKDRPAVVLSSDHIGRLAVKLVIPLTHWQNRYARSSWHVPVNPTSTNGLTVKSSADGMQVKTADLSRFVKKLGWISSDDLEDIRMAIRLVIG